MSSILIIDDNAATCEVLEAILRAEGYTVRSVSEGRQGIEIALASPPDLVLCDVVMPGMGGHAVMARLRHDPRTALCPFVFLTGVSDMESMRTAMDLGADDYLVKPVRSDQLRRVIQMRLARRAAARREAQSRLEELRTSIAHTLPQEFLTPLTAVLGLSSLLADKDALLENVSVRDVAQGIFDAGRRLEELVEKFLLYAELEAAEQDPGWRDQAKEFRVEGVREVVETIARRYAGDEGRDGDLWTEVDELALPMRKDHLRALVTELVQNAFTFSRPGTRVSVTLHRGPAGCDLAVADGGRGMSRDEIALLGTLVQLHRRRLEQPGTGLGLAIVRRIATLYGGDMEIDSLPGPGTVVRVMLPAAIA